MTRFTVIAIILGTTLLAGCSVSKEGTSLSDFKWVDNNCSGDGFFVNESWCRDTLHPSMGPYAAK
jgi:outer membrane protein assembly factor BamE (lipoprotein component of BamABCDE complex)